MKNNLVLKEGDLVRVKLVEYYATGFIDISNSQICSEFHKNNLYIVDSIIKNIVIEPLNKGNCKCIECKRFLGRMSFSADYLEFVETKIQHERNKKLKCIISN
jgi:hypothetical protein